MRAILLAGGLSLIFTLIGMGISALLRKGLTWIKADERFARTRLSLSRGTTLT